MKKISILAIITLLFIAVEFVSAFVDLWGYKSLSGIVKQSTEVVGKSIDGDHRTFTIVQSLNMVPVEDKLALDTLENTYLDTQIPYGVGKVVVCGWLPMWMAWVSFLFLIALPLAIWGIVNFIKLLISVFKHEIFTRKNARRLRIFVYTNYGIIAVSSICDWVCYRCVASQTIMPGYVVGNYEFAVSWSDMFLMCLFAEIFALGVKLQGEQELTI